VNTATHMRKGQCLCTLIYGKLRQESGNVVNPIPQITCSLHNSYAQPIHILVTERRDESFYARRRIMHAVFMSEILGVEIHSTAYKQMQR
jgi:hypothetical protein